ncbi:MAG: DUF58 domain-containing protein [Candidatus Obscuribacterales bacterium]|nr:DUF58 domain-containing protein [Candidatus Obscuribacterales bacterium]
MSERKDNAILELIGAVEERAINSPIPVRWRTSQIFGGTGERPSRNRGFNGFDFHSLRPYQYADDPRKIDWGASARSGDKQLLVRQTQEPREVKFYILVDSKLTMDFGTRRTSKRLVAAELAASILNSAKKTNDKVGYLVYDEKQIQAMSFRANFAATVKLPCLSAIIEPGLRHLYPEDAPEPTVLDSGDGDVPSGLIQSLRYVRNQSRAVVFIISDFIDLSDDEKEELAYTAGIHDTICMYVQDLRERELPNTWGIYMLQDIRKGTSKAIWLPPKWWPFQSKNSVREQYALNFRERRKALFAFFKEASIRWEEFSTEEGLSARDKLIKLFSGNS